MQKTTPTKGGAEYLRALDKLFMDDTSTAPKSEWAAGTAAHHDRIKETISEIDAILRSRLGVMGAEEQDAYHCAILDLQRALMLAGVDA